jgi:hypothetical protein
VDTLLIAMVLGVIPPHINGGKLIFGSNGGRDERRE